jgi:hypothetical protein
MEGPFSIAVVRSQDVLFHPAGDVRQVKGLPARWAAFLHEGTGGYHALTFEDRRQIAGQLFKLITLVSPLEGLPQFIDDIDNLLAATINDVTLTHNGEHPTCTGCITCKRTLPRLRAANEKLREFRDQPGGTKAAGEPAAPAQETHHGNEAAVCPTPPAVAGGG